jgi:hypothetical protein
VKKEVWKRTDTNRHYIKYSGPPLTPEQRTALEQLAATMDEPTPEPTDDDGEEEQR